MLKFVVLVAVLSVAFAGPTVLPTLLQFTNAVKFAVYPVPKTIKAKYDAFIRSNTFVSQKLKHPIFSSKKETAMFVAQCLHETGGFNKLKEAKPLPQFGKYYGRGYIQLSGQANYKACSKDLYGNTVLETNPDRVLQSEDESWRSAFWFWGRNCHFGPDVKSGNFPGTTSNCIRPVIPNQASRDKAYKATLKAFGL